MKKKGNLRELRSKRDGCIEDKPEGNGYAEPEDLFLFKPHMLWKKLTQWVGCRIQQIWTSKKCERYFNCPESLRL